MEEKKSEALMSRKKARNNSNGAMLGFEETLWQAADKQEADSPGEKRDVDGDLIGSSGTEKTPLELR